MSQPILTKDMLNPIVRKVCDEESVSVVDFTIEELQGGTVGQVLKITGTAQGVGVQRSWSVILKIQRAWLRSGDPASWLREMRMYQSHIFDDLPEGVGVPRCLHVEWPQAHEIWLWMEMVEGVTDTEMGLAEYAVAARNLGRLQGQHSLDNPLPADAWLSTRYWQAHNVLNWGTGAFPWLGENEGKPQEPPFSSELVAGLQRLWDQRDDLLDLIPTLPRTLCHRDYTPGNIFVKHDAIEIIDWDCAGIGVVGEDVADLVGEALVYYDFDEKQARQLANRVLDSYKTGLREAGWQGEDSVVDLGFAVNLVLHWTFRVIARLRDTDDQTTIHTYGLTLQFLYEVSQEYLAITKPN